MTSSARVRIGVLGTAAAAEAALIHPGRTSWFSADASAMTLPGDGIGSAPMPRDPDPKLGTQFGTQSSRSSCWIALVLTGRSGAVTAPSPAAWRVDTGG
jgi:hypothetical protein